MLVFCIQYHERSSSINAANYCVAQKTEACLYATHTHTQSFMTHQESMFCINEWAPNSTGEQLDSSW